VVRHAEQTFRCRIFILVKFGDFGPCVEHTLCGCGWMFVFALLNGAVLVWVVVLDSEHHEYALPLSKPCLMYVVLPKISENLNIPRKPSALRTCAARCLILYLSTNSLANGVCISARVSEFWLLSLHHFHECLRILKWRALRSKELALNFASSSTKLQLRPTESSYI